MPNLATELKSDFMTINITVKLFAAYQEAYGKSELSLDLPAPLTVNDLLAKLVSEKPELTQWQEVTRFGVNLDFVDPETLLNDGDVVVFIPPVIGG